jgi:hypothetical protein
MEKGISSSSENDLASVRLDTAPLVAFYKKFIGPATLSFGTIKTYSHA